MATGRRIPFSTYVIPTQSVEGEEASIRHTEYVSTVGAKDYLGKIRQIPNTSIKINYFKFNHKTSYSQNQQLSAIDLLFNEGPNSINIIRKGFQIEKE